MFKNSRLSRRITASFLAVLLLFHLAAPIASAEPVRVTPDPAADASLSALQAKREAIRLVESMPYPDPDRTPPGKELRKEFILLDLRASIDGTMRGDNFLTDGAAFDRDVSAVKRLRDLSADPHVGDEVKNAARTAIRLIVHADRVVTAAMLEATGVFGADVPKDGADLVRRARQELAKGDDKAAKGMPVDAIRDYRKAWEYARQAVDRLWTALDADGDRVIAELEARLGTNPRAADTDGDGLTDGEEFTRTGTDPTRADSDGSGSSDAQKDLDGDGLSNREEIAAQTNPLRPDTDGDGLTDDSEHRLGLDPRRADQNENGTPDGLEEYTTTAVSPDGTVAVELTGIGDIARAVAFRDLSEHALFGNVPGMLSAPVDVTVDRSFTRARVKIRFDPARVPGGDYEHLQLLWYDETNRVFLPLDRSGVDVAGGYAWAETTHFSTFALFYIPNWQAVWTHPGPRNPTGPQNRFFDVMLILDSSGSMAWNDPYGYRKTAAKAFIDGLLAGDRVGVVDFDSTATLLQPLTDDVAAAKQAVDRIDDSGGTNIASGVAAAHRELLQNGDPAHLKVEILLTDGEGYYDPALTVQAKNAGIVIYTVGLGSSVDAALLESIARGTGGQSYAVSSAADLPNVFRRIAEGEADATDTDGDGLPDAVERAGLLTGTGVRIPTDPGKSDTDGDGDADGWEAGKLAASTWGSYYAIVSNPASTDPDRDGLTDAEEKELGTHPYLADTDGDGLDDLVELNADFDPNDANPDGDHRSDRDEWLKGSDPFYKDLNGWDYARAVLAGFVLGDAGKSWVDLGWIDRETLESFAYVSGWLASGYVGIGDVRDTAAALARADLGDAFLNALGLVPMLGDAAKTVKVVAQWVSWLQEAAKPIARWIVRQFGENEALTVALLRLVGYSDELELYLSREEIVELARSRNDLGEIARFLRSGARLEKGSLSGAQWEAVMARAAQWPAGARAQAIAVETAVELLKDTHEFLYIGRRGQWIELLDGTRRQLEVGPDLVAVDRRTGRLVVVEAKGGSGALSVNKRRLTSVVQKTELVQPSFEWLRVNSQRYLDPLANAADPKLREAARRLELVVDGLDTFDAVVVASGRSTRWGGDLDKVLKDLSVNTASVRLIKIDHP